MSDSPVTRDDSLLPSAPADRAAPPSAPRRRRKAPKDSKIRKAVLAALIGRCQGFTRAEIAEQLGLSVRTLNAYMYTASKKGLVGPETATSPEDRLEYFLSQQAVDNLGAFLTDKDSCKGDKEVTLEVAKGLGLLKSHQVQKVDGSSQVGVALRVQVDMPFQRPDLAVEIDPKAVGGTPLYEAEIVTEEGDDLG